MAANEFWQASASQSTLRARAELLRQIRAFFESRGVLEVETPLLCQETALEPHLNSFQVAAAPRYLQTSPEFAMKRLLASGSGAIYQICKAFRQSENGARHNPEFTLLEWYRPEFYLQDLIAEVAELVSIILGEHQIELVSYASVFEQFVGLHPFSAPLTELAAIAVERCGYSGSIDERDLFLDLLMSQLVEPNLGIGKLTFVQDFPATQAALACIGEDKHGFAVARRFELYVNGLELANGYDELLDAEDFKRRCEQNLQARAAQKLPQYPMPDKLIAATPFLPRCCGVALGIDRLLVLLCDLDRIEECLAFPYVRA